MLRLYHPAIVIVHDLSVPAIFPLTFRLQRLGLQVDAAAADAADHEEPLVLAMSQQQRVLHAAQALSLQLPANPVTTNPPPPISMSGDPEPLPHLPPPPPTPRVYSINEADLQVMCDVRCVMCDK